jgi:hypothetical protein
VAVCDAAPAPAAGTERISCSLLPRSSSDSGAHMLRASGDSGQGWVQEAARQAACQWWFGCALHAGCASAKAYLLVAAHVHACVAFLCIVQLVACMPAASERHQITSNHADIRHPAQHTPLLTLLLRACIHRPHRYSNHADSDSDGEEVQSRRKPDRAAAGEGAAGPAAASWPAAAGTRSPRLRLHSRLAADAVPSASEQVGAWIL